MNSLSRMEAWALRKKIEALELAVQGLIQQQQALAALPDLVCDQVRLADLRWNLVMATASGAPAVEKAKRELNQHLDYIEQKYRKVANG